MLNPIAIVIDKPHPIGEVVALSFAQFVFAVAKNSYKNGREFP
ncbi:MAG: hypothetical protein WC494_02535 [Candidatus Pacearchaeota archaeon]